MNNSGLNISELKSGGVNFGNTKDMSFLLNNSIYKYNNYFPEIF